MFRKRYGLAAVLAGLVFQAYGASASAADVIATGLKSPRGLDFAPNGQLYVAEAGAISSTGKCFEGGMGTQCYTETGAVTLIDAAGIQPAKQVIKNLPTLGDVGPADVSFHGMKAYVAIGLGSDPANRSVLSGLGAAKADLLGTVISFNPNALGNYNTVADISALEVNNPDGFTGDGNIDSNPFGVLALPGRQIVADAGGNDLFEVKANGSTRLLAVFPAEPSAATGPRQRVPSRVTLGPDGYLYVAEEAFSSGPGGGRIYRVPPAGCQPVDACPVFIPTNNWGGTGTVVSGVWSVMDLQFDRSGNLYYVEFISGTLWKVNTAGVKTAVYTGLSQPGGLALSDDAAYVSNRTLCYGVVSGSCPAGSEYGEVLRIPLN